KGGPYENTDNSASIVTIMQDRFYYAMFLNNNIGKSRNPDILSLLKPFGEATANSDPSFKETRARFTRSLVLGSSGDFVKTSALALAGISPEFKQFLASIGLKP